AGPLLVRRQPIPLAVVEEPEWPLFEGLDSLGLRRGAYGPVVLFERRSSSNTVSRVESKLVRERSEITPGRSRIDEARRPVWREPRGFDVAEFHHQNNDLRLAAEHRV